MTKIINFSESRRGTDDALGDLHALFGDELQQVELAIAGHMKSAAALIPEISEHLIGAGGKRLRPLLTLSAARLANYQGRDHITMAAAVEYMHTATLLHDDVVDDSDMRRGQPTARNLGAIQPASWSVIFCSTSLPHDGRCRFPARFGYSLIGCGGDCRRRSHAIGGNE